MSVERAIKDLKHISPGYLHLQRIVSFPKRMCTVLTSILSCDKSNTDLLQPLVLGATQHIEKHRCMLYFHRLDRWFVQHHHYTHWDKACLAMKSVVECFVSVSCLPLIIATWKLDMTKKYFEWNESRSLEAEFRWSNSNSSSHSRANENSGLKANFFNRFPVTILLS